MESIIVMLVLVLIFLLVLPAIVSMNSNAKIREMKKEIDLLKKYIIDLHKSFESIKNLPQKSIVEKAVQPKPNQITAIPQQEKPETEKPKEQAPKETLPKVGVPQLEIPKEEPPKEEIKPLPQNLNPQAAKQQTAIPKTEPVQVVKKKTNFEQFIGEKLISLVGIGILVLGIFFTVKWAIDRNMISDAGKILIGLGAATILIALAHKLSKNYRAFSSILAGGGIAVLYFSIYQAYQSYHLLPQAGAFVAMVFITLLAVVLSLIYDKKELAVIALLGGFCTPFFVSKGSGNYQVLFSYILLLNAGMFALAFFKKWNLLNIIGYVLSVSIFGLWILNTVKANALVPYGGLLFATLFYLVFFATNIIYNLRYRQKFATIEISMLLSNSFLYLGAGLFFLQHIAKGQQQGLFVIALAVFNFIFAWLFFKNQQVDKNLIYLLIGLVLTFVSLAGPVQLDGNYITLFWATEAALLYWLGVRSKLHLVKNASPVVVVLCLISLGMDWQQNYFAPQVNKLPVILNKAFITGLVVVSALVVKYKWVKRDDEKAICWNGLPLSLYAKLLEGLIAVVIYMVGFREIYYQSFTISRVVEFQSVVLWGWHFIFVAVLLWYAIRYREALQQKVLTALSGFSLLVYPLADVSITQLRTICLSGNAAKSYFYYQWLILVSALGIIALLIFYLRKNDRSTAAVNKWAPWFLTITGLYVLSSSIIQCWVFAAFEPGFHWSEAAGKAVKVGLPILWALVSLTLMWVGMRQRVKQLRIISLSLFLLTIIKLFVYDISNVSQGGKIAAFVILGVVLLIVSFMYQKIKNLFTDENENNLDATSEKNEEHA